MSVLCDRQALTRSVSGVSADHVELPAQVRAEDPYREGGRHPENDQQPVLSGDSVHRGYCLPKRRGMTAKSVAEQMLSRSRSHFTFHESLFPCSDHSAEDQTQPFC